MERREKQKAKIDNEREYETETETESETGEKFQNKKDRVKHGEEEVTEIEN